MKAPASTARGISMLWVRLKGFRHDEEVDFLSLCPACAVYRWPGALHLDKCPNKPKEDA